MHYVRANHMKCGLICTAILIVALGFNDSSSLIIRLPAGLVAVTMVVGIGITIIIAAKKSNEE